jgi:two-component system CheB/CheR fusion protein
MPGNRRSQATRPDRKAEGQPAQSADLPRERGAFPVVGIGASAGGLDACRKLVEALSAVNGMAFILVQHLDPTHESMMVELLAGHTAMLVRQAADAMPVERDHLYVIPPGRYLSVGGGALRLSEPQVRHGARLPFDFLLHSLAEAYGDRAVGVILSGTGTDGSLGLKSVKAKGGFVIAQDPDEAAYDGMPRSAIATGIVDLVLPVGEMPAALVNHAQGMPVIRPQRETPPEPSIQNRLPEIIDLLRTKTSHDFRQYKPGTLLRRIERRMAMAAIKSDDMIHYLRLLRRDASELDLLAKDLLINVTSFFRDPEVFDFLAEKIVPDLVRSHASDQPVRIWIAGCSTGEEAYSLAMLFREEITAAKRNIKLQLFASDVDSDAVASAREGFYPATIEAEVSPERLARFFTKEEHGYRVQQELRSVVVFTVQDVLADPPFSRLDMVSCRNLLIYLQPEAQAKAVLLFHFALRNGGILLLGNAETMGNPDGRFEVISKPARVYRHIGHTRPGEIGFPIGGGDAVRVPVHSPLHQTASRQAALAELCRRLALETWSPAAVLINSKHECLFSLGPTERYLRVARGPATLDVLAMVQDSVGIKLRSAIQRADEENSRVRVIAGRPESGGTISFTIDVQPIPHEGEKLLLIGFVDEPVREQEPGRPYRRRNSPRVAELEKELGATRTELHSAIQNLEIANREQKAINQEALSVNEEFQSTNEELLTSKEELQSLNEELTALNSQLQETLERQRTTANDLQNVLYSTDVATLFLDTNLDIRFFTPATKALFNLIPGDVGRPLADLNPLAGDGSLLTDAQAVLQNLAPVEREIEARSGAWYVRRILPYRTQNDGVEGVVITFVDVTERKHTEEALGTAKQQAERATAAKSRFLAAASHDLRQPLQTLALIQGLLAKTAVEEQRHLLARLDDTLGAMSGMLNTLLNIDQIEIGAHRPEVVEFSVSELFGRLRDEFGYHARAKGLKLHVVPCGLTISSDPNLLERMVRNLLSNALKYTKRGKVLLGCRRRADKLSIEVWDTGIGIPEAELHAIFDEYRQVANPTHERSLGLGLGLSIVQRLASILGHRVSVRSELGKGSVFTIDITLQPNATPHGREPRPPGIADLGVAARGAKAPHRTGSILVVEDDSEVCDLLTQFLKGEGHRVAAASDGADALELVAHGAVRPDLILTDYNLPGGMDGLQLAAKLRDGLHRQVPVIMLTGDISGGPLLGTAIRDSVSLSKPVKLTELTQAIEHLLPVTDSVSKPRALGSAEALVRPSTPVIYVVDDDAHIRLGIRTALEAEGRTVEDFADCQTFLEAYRPGGEACLLIDASLPGMSGLELLRRLHDAGRLVPSIMITGNGDVPMAVQAMKAGALDFIEKPVSLAELLVGVERALEQSRDASKLSAWREEAANHVAELTRRQRQIMERVLAGEPSKNIAADLGISQRTVENHRAAIMKKTGAKSLPALARLALAAAWKSRDEPSA